MIMVFYSQIVAEIITFRFSINNIIWNQSGRYLN